MKASALREIGVAELAQKTRETARELQELRLKHASSHNLERPLRMRAVRRDVARMRTVLRERENQAR